MIISRLEGDIFTTKDRHIIFALNKEGINDSGFAGQVAKRGFTEILETGGNKLGDVVEKTINGITYHGIVCHSLYDGWDGAPEIILEVLNNMDFTEEASIVPIGAGFIGMMQGAPTEKIFEAFQRCNKKLTVWSK